MSLKNKITYVFLIAAISACSKQVETIKTETIRPVKLMEVSLLSEREYSFPGEVEASEQVTLAFRVSGQIKKYHIRSGENVKQGQLLIELDPKDYLLSVNAAKASLDLATVQHKRSAVLIKDFLISQENYDLSKTALQVAQSYYQTAKANLTYTKIYAPYDGVVANTYSKNFEFSMAQQPVMSLQSEGAIDVVISVPERLVAPIKKIRQQGNQAKLSVVFSVDSDTEYKATFKDISTIADSATGSYEVTLTLLSPDNLRLFAGMSAIVKCQLSLTEKDLVTAIPRSAVFTENTQRYVWKFDTTRQLLDKIEVEFDDNFHLLTGLNDGDQIVISGVNELNASSKVKPWKKERGL